MTDRFRLTFGEAVEQVRRIYDDYEASDTPIESMIFIAVVDPVITLGVRAELHDLLDQCLNHD